MNETRIHASTKDKRHTEVLARFTAPVSSVKERVAAGKSLRERVPHARHAEYRPAPARMDPVSILEQQAKSRLPTLVPIRYARMLTNPFAFLRGSAAVMAADLAATPVTGLTVQACGDMHLANFGVFASAERNLVFGINDFDETLPGPWEWDLKRLAASVVVSAQVLGGDKVFSADAVRTTVSSYRTRMREYAWMGHLDVWYASIDERNILGALSPEVQKGAVRIITKAKRQGHLQTLDKAAELVDGRLQIVEDRPLIVRETHTAAGRPIADALGRTLALYLDSLPEDRKALLTRYRVVDVARKVVGVGSVGTRCWVILLTGNGPDDPLFLQYKEAQPSVLAPYVQASPWDCEGRRVVVGQRIIQGAPDIFLGWGKQGDGTHFYMRQLRDMKGGVKFEPGKVSLQAFPEYCMLCGWALALAHAKSGDSATIAGYLGKGEGMDEAIVRFAAAYAEQTERDFDTLNKAVKEKRIVVAASP